MRKNGASKTDGDCFETLNLLHLSSCEMFTFCVVLHGAKQTMQINTREGAVRTDSGLLAGRLFSKCHLSRVHIRPRL